jgi:hypothetical protein
MASDQLPWMSIPGDINLFQGAAKKKSVTPVVGWWVRGQKRTWVRFVFDFLF